MVIDPWKQVDSSKEKHDILDKRSRAGSCFCRSIMGSFRPRGTTLNEFCNHIVSIVNKRDSSNNLFVEIKPFYFFLKRSKKVLPIKFQRKNCIWWKRELLHEKNLVSQSIFIFEIQAFLAMVDEA